MIQAFVDAEQILNDPEDLTEETASQNGLYAHRCQVSRTCRSQPRSVATFPRY
jgi:hypothetical protein